MRTLLVHDSDDKQVEKVNTWRDAREGINDFFQLSVDKVSSSIFVRKRNETMKYLEKKIQTAIESHGINKVLVFLSQEYEELPKSLLEESMPEVKFAYVINH